MHTLILSGLETETEPIKTAEEVLQEIDDMMMEDTLSDISPINEMFEKGRDILRCPLRNESIRNFFYFKCRARITCISLILNSWSNYLMRQFSSLLNHYLT